MKKQSILWAALAFALVASNEARADLVIGVEAGPLLRLDPPSDESIGFNFGGRVGYQLDLPLIAFTPEVKLVFDGLPQAANVQSARVMAGARLALGEVLAPVAFAHGGYGSISGNGGKGLAIDLGVGLDFTPIPFLDLGIFASYNRVFDDPDVKIHWLSVGAHAAIVF
jgi:hypothetical protein